MPSLALGRSAAFPRRLMALALFLALVLQAGLAQAQTRPLRAGLLFLGPEATYPGILQALRSSFGQYGYTEGQNLVLVPRYAEGHAERLPALARELAAEKVDVIITGGERNLVVARTTVPEIPVVVVACESIEKLLGLFAQHQGNATGFSCISTTLYGKRIEYLKSVVPGLRRLALLYNPAEFPATELAATETARTRLGIAEIGQFPVRSREELATAFQRMADEKYDGLYVSLNTFTFVNAKRIAELSLQYRLPMISSAPEFPEYGALMSYGASLVDGFRRAAYFADRIFKGTPVSQLPAEEPTKFWLVLNETTASELGLSFPPLLLAGADKLID